MAIANVCFNPEQDGAAIEWSGHPVDLPINAVNEALNVLQDNPERLKLFLYEVYNGRSLLGLLITENFNPESDAEIRSIWDGIIDQNRNVALGGDLAPIQVNV